MKPEPVSPPRAARSSTARARGIVFREPTQEATSPRGNVRLVKPKRECGEASRREPAGWAPVDDEEDFLVKQALAASLNDVPPMPLDQALAWSRAEYEAAEAERRRRLEEYGGIVDISDGEEEWDFAPTPPR